MSLLFLVEVGLRWCCGFGAVPVYYSSVRYEYALSPNQEMHRFGNRFAINEVGMRSAPLGAAEWRILKFGDSVLNGGVSTDQRDLASARLEAALDSVFPEKGMRVLNVSAGSWGPDNAYAWMEAYGHFDAQVVVLVFSSHDWQDQMTFREVVGRVPFYPDRSPALALTDALTWGWSRYLGSVDWDALPLMEGAMPTEAPHNTGWDAFADFCEARELPLLVYHHPTLREWREGAWDADGAALQSWCSARGVPVVSGLEASYSAQAYRDAIHPNAEGQRAIASALLPALHTYIAAYHD